jgi:predicted TPR repeat methyltransferase
MTDLSQQPGLPPPVSPVSPAAAERNRRVADALERHIAGDFVAAEAEYRAVLEEDPNHAGALHGMGVICYQAGRNSLAIDYLEASVAINDQDAVAYANLGNAFRAIRKWPRAVESYSRATHLQPMLRDGWSYLSESLVHLKQFDRARRAALRACALAPDRPDGWFRLGEAERMLGHPLEAQAAYRSYLTLDPADRLGAAVAIAAAGGERPDRVPADFVTRLFDDYAGSFDYHLTTKLGYSGPRHLRRLLQPWLDGLDRAPTVADLGCGTGLMAAELLDVGAVLDGVDLSPKMIAKARGKGFYTTLHVGDLIDWLADPPRRPYDLIIASDVLNYLGDLTPVFARLRPLLAIDGRAIFTLETNDRTATFDVGSRLRFRHNRSHVADLAVAAGFEVISITDAVLRKEAGRPVRSIVVQLAVSA